MKQPVLAPVAMGGGLVGGVAAMLLGGYRITDCLMYKQEMGFCDKVVEQNIMSVVGGVAAIIGTWGGLFTYNKKLERPGSSTAPAVMSAIAVKEYDKASYLEDLFDDKKSLELRVLDAYEATGSETDTADMLGITRYRVRKILGRI